MRQIIFWVLSTLVCLTFGLSAVYAQGSGVDMSKCITLTVRQGEKIKLNFGASTAGVKGKVTGVKNEKEEVASTDFVWYNDQPEYEALGTEIKVYGAIDQFTCYRNGANLKVLDVSQNVNLTGLYCYNNQLSSLDVSKNVNLKVLNCEHNQLSSLDVSKNINLDYLNCSDNQLSSLDVSKNVNLTGLTCSHNQLSSLVVRENVNLDHLNCNNNQLFSLDMSKNINLELLTCEHNQLSSLEVSKNINLKRLECGNNQLLSLDMSNNVNLAYLNCSDNQLSSLDVSSNVLEDIYIYGNNFSTSSLNSLYCQLPNRAGQPHRGTIYPVYKKGNVDELLVKSTSKQITDSKNWKIKYEKEGDDIEDITGNYTCSSVYALTLEPAELSNSFTYHGGEWKTTVTSEGNWKLDETTPLPAWLKVDTKQGNSGAQVTITVDPFTGNLLRRTALTFALADNASTKQVVIIRQNAKPPLIVNPTEEYTFPIAGEKKENYFTVESSGTWKVTSDADWLDIKPKEGNAGEKKVTIEAKPNSGNARMAKLTFAHKDNNKIRQVVTLKQEGKTEQPTPKPNPNAVEDAVFADVVVAPNPFHNQLRITNGNLGGEYILLNAQGVKVASGALEASETIVNTSALSAGIYLLQLNATGGATKTYRVVKR